MDKCSLLIATYNWPVALELCLKSVLIQKTLPGEIIIADDGSREETKELIDRLRTDFPIPLRHVWQLDEGFQLARIRNKGIAAASFSYIIQIDGDLILHPYFIEDHLKLSKPGYFTTGSRMLLSPHTTQRVIEKGQLAGTKVFAGNKNIFNGLRNKWIRNLLAHHYKNKGKNIFYVKGCNMAFWKDDLIKVNGYNESFFGWGKEDSEIAIRLMNAGVKKQFLKMGGICYHLYHREVSREMEEKNTQMMTKAIKAKFTWAETGLSQYLS